MEFPKDKAKHYSGFTLYPFFHKKEQMGWASAAVIHLDEAERLIFLSGATGRDPEVDRQPRSWQEQRAGVGKVVGGIKEQTRGVWTRIKETLEGLDAGLEDLVFRRSYLANRDDWWDCFETVRDFNRENCPDLLENPRAGTLLKNTKLALPDMLMEVETVAVTGKKQTTGAKK